MAHRLIARSKFGEGRTLPRGITVFVIGICWCLVGLVAEIFNGFDFDEEALISPITALVYLVDKNPDFGDFISVAVAMSLFGIPAMIYWLYDISCAVAEGKQIVNDQRTKESSNASQA